LADKAKDRAKDMAKAKARVSLRGPYCLAIPREKNWKVPHAYQGFTGDCVVSGGPGIPCA